MTRTVLIIDDDPSAAGFLNTALTRAGWTADVARTGMAGLQAYDAARPDLVLLDYDLPDVGGFEVLHALRARDPDATVIMVTGLGDVSTAVEAMRLGAENFLAKPVNLSHFEAAVERAHEKAVLKQRARYHEARVAESVSGVFLGDDPAMREVSRLVARAAAGSAPVLLLGETGTGKGLIAKQIHRLSDRAGADFVELNSAGLSATFLDSELFGHERGAFTDARTQKAGLFEIAHRGTLFLDEVGDLAPSLQPKVLKVIEEQRFRRLGGAREIVVDARLIAATHRDLGAAVEAGEFRQDLFYRLAVFPITLPALRERGADTIVALATRLATALAARIGERTVRFSAEALELLVAYAWPGNVRELSNVLERMLMLHPRIEEVGAEHLPAELTGDRRDRHEHVPKDLSLASVERRHIERVLEQCGGNVAEAAERLAIGRATLYRKLKSYGH
ncbi:MAG: hypothetical protein JWM41_1486 [Gemmatimonadetes bacterium]|nr:hypothetical protein [Gemmatimonadota bacterium]